MNPVTSLALAFPVIALLAVTQPASAQGKSACVLAGGEATMVTEDLARFMANAALENSIKGMGSKAAGPVKMICTPATLSTHCIARQRACK